MISPWVAPIVPRTAASALASAAATVSSVGFVVHATSHSAAPASTCCRCGAHTSAHCSSARRITCTAQHVNSLSRRSARLRAMCAAARMRSGAAPASSSSATSDEDGGQREVGMEDGASKAATAYEGAKNTIWRKEVPFIAPPEEHLQRALKVGSRAALDARSKRGRSRFELHKLTSTKRVETLKSLLADRLREYLDAFPSSKRLHAYERELIHLTLSAKDFDRFGGYDGVLRASQQLQRKVVEQGDLHAKSLRRAKNTREVDQNYERAFQALEEIYRAHFPVVERLKSMAKMLHRLQIPDVSLPTIILAGAPNVGKSSLVRLYSSGVPEVQSYPFTTRSIIMGHFEHHGETYQMTDTPGLLNRGEHERNLIERLTITALEHLRATVLFIVDLTEDCGTDVQQQLELRTSLRERYPAPRTQWIDVLSKSDLGLRWKSLELYESSVRGDGGDYMSVSVVSEDGLDALRTRILETLALPQEPPSDDNLPAES